MINRIMIIVISALIVVLSACVQEDATQPANVDPTAKPAEKLTPEKPAEQSTVSRLAGTSWTLVKIMEMNDNVIQPDDASGYTIEFGDDGQVAIQADCNRATGGWASESPSGLQFGTLAATMAMCPPGSVSDVYLAQFEWVRSFVFKDGHLFLATMADGSIIEFEPLQPVP